MNDNSIHILVAHDFYNDDIYLNSNLFWVISYIYINLDNPNKEELYIFIKNELEAYTSGNCDFEKNNLDILLSGNSIETLYDSGIFISECNISLIKIDDFEKIIHLSSDMLDYILNMYFENKYEIIKQIIHSDNTIILIKDITDNSRYVISKIQKNR